MATAIAVQPLAPRSGTPNHHHLSRPLINNAMQHKSNRASLQALKSADGQRSRKERPCMFDVTFVSICLPSNLCSR